MIDPNNNFFDETTIYFDNASQRQRVDITFNNPNETPLTVQIYLFPALGFAYRVTPLPDSTPNCARTTYILPLKPLCFTGQPLNRNPRIGRQTVFEWALETELTVDTYRLYSNGQYLVPVQILSRWKSAPTSLSSFLQYLDFSVGTPNPAVFALPPACLALTAAEPPPNQSNEGSKND
ncbi:MAG: hypothetical protein JNL98_13735 [Bryobacterales bacterium]|nr:hypothetical protein [Bryobacterales bacterium]